MFRASVDVGGYSGKAPCGAVCCLLRVGTLVSLPAGLRAVFQFMVCSLGVVFQLFRDRSSEVEFLSASKVEDTNHRIGKFNFKHLTVWEMVVHQILAIT